MSRRLLTLLVLSLTLIGLAPGVWACPAQMQQHHHCCIDGQTAPCGNDTSPGATLVCCAAAPGSTAAVSAAVAPDSSKDWAQPAPFLPASAEPVFPTPAVTALDVLPLAQHVLPDRSLTYLHTGRLRL